MKCGDWKSCLLFSLVFEGFETGFCRKSPISTGKNIKIRQIIEPN